jgi:hypothetical protein
MWITLYKLLSYTHKKTGVETPVAMIQKSVLLYSTQI